MGYKNIQLGNSEVNNTKYEFNFNTALREHFCLCNLINFITSLLGGIMVQVVQIICEWFIY